jgi:hypothetical protein
MALSPVTGERAFLFDSMKVQLRTNIKKQLKELGTAEVSTPKVFRL